MLFDFERKFVNKNTQAWMIEHWTDSIYYAGIYLIVIFGLEHHMRKKHPLRINRILIIWNAILAVFSVIGTCRTLPEFLNTLSENGFHGSVCDSSFIATNQVTGVWIFLFVLSKLWEFGDTIFLVLRKRPLTFLHVYHHTIAIIYAWFSYSEFASVTRWFAAMNFFVHSIMYSYYALCAMNCKPPKQIAMLITGLQIVQMIFGCIVNASAYIFIVSNMDCQVTKTNLMFSAIMYVSFVILFSRFFKNAYIRNKQKRN